MFIEQEREREINSQDASISAGKNYGTVIEPAVLEKMGLQLFLTIRISERAWASSVMTDEFSMESQR